MTTEGRTGRPRASSRETLAEAACELFLEQGYERTSVADIAQRAGVSRSSFFNYFEAKSEVFWAGLDERIARLGEADDEADPDAAVRRALAGLGEGFAPDSLALALLHADAMGLGVEFERDAASRQVRIGHLAADRLRRGGVDPLVADVRGAAYGGAVAAALRRWAARPGASLADAIRVALAAVPTA
ncbi:helix-turn-helix domain-containing protein [Microbacterium sp. X-17]|uniref:TetR/AcrR family transcriptional regulator n=1 Tax=Microbacterium sp. X-17 TaxID=3144404 RepID=UPI0031F4FC71